MEGATKGSKQTCKDDIFNSIADEARELSSRKSVSERRLSFDNPHSTHCSQTGGTVEIVIAAPRGETRALCCAPCAALQLCDSIHDVWGCSYAPNTWMCPIYSKILCHSR